MKLPRHTLTQMNEPCMAVITYNTPLKADISVVQSKYCMASVTHAQQQSYRGWQRKTPCAADQTNLPSVRKGP